MSAQERIQMWSAALSIEQKVALLVGMGINLPGAFNVQQAEKVPGAAGSTYPIPELKLPSMILSDGPAGVRIEPKREGSKRSYYCTAFPIASLLASSWDTELVASVGQAMGVEAREYGIDVMLMPGMNLQRDPRGGRNFEYYSEDPLLSGKMAAAIVQGMQATGVGASIKHFAANNQETNRMVIDTLVDERALRELYLRGFEIAVKEAKPWTVMSAYNQINGIPASQHQWLLQTVLRDEWGFEGLVMSDWFAGEDAVAQMQAGNDLLMPGTPEQKAELIKAVQEGRLAETVLDTNLQRFFTLLLKTPVANNYAYSEQPDLSAHAKIARQVATEGIVLLKNERALPLKAGSKIAAFGIGSYDFIAGGTGSGDVNKAYTVSLVEGLQATDFEVNANLQQIYTAYLATEKAKQPTKQYFFELIPPVPELTLPTEILAKAVAESDIGLITLGRNSGEFQDRELEGDYYLTATEQTLIKTVAAAYHAAGKPVVLVLNIGNVIETASWRDQVDAIVLAWQGGQEAGHAVTAILAGTVNPSGKLTTSFSLNYADVPSAPYFPGERLPHAQEHFFGPLSKGWDSQVEYKEGIYVGYRHYCTRNKTVAYPFGFGLSYTQFTYTNLQLSSSSFQGELTLTVEITNSGELAGKEVVQVYLAAPALSMDKPSYELRAFAKTQVLQPQASQILSFRLSERDLASWSTATHRWVVDSGEYQIKIGASCLDIRAEASFQLI